LVAASTGPLHLAAALGIYALGIYPPIRPMHPGRWAPVGEKAKVFVKEKDCEACRLSADCTCIREIRPQQLVDYLQSLPPAYRQPLPPAGQAPPPAGGKGK
jgi:ADP-heptose:LPS heptosyltransferase